MENTTKRVRFQLLEDVFLVEEAGENFPENDFEIKKTIGKILKKAVDSDRENQ